MLNNDKVYIELDKSRALRLTYNATKTFKAKFGKTFSQVDAKNFDMEDVARILYVAMLEEDPGIPFEKVEELLNNVSLGYALAKMTEVIEAAFPKNLQRAAKNEENQTGTNS